VKEGSEGVATRKDLVAHMSRWFDAETARSVIEKARKDSSLTEHTDGHHTSDVFN
jgi:hypothetical protein